MSGDYRIPNLASKEAITQNMEGRLIRRSLAQMAYVTGVTPFSSENVGVESIMSSDPQERFYS